MATVYSLICFGGKDGKTVTFTDAGDVVNLTNHGLRDATEIVFTDNGNTLPTGLSKNTTYWAKSTASGTFTLYNSAALTTQVTFTGTGTGTHKVKSRYYYDLSDKSRWTYSTVEYIFDSLKAWRDARNTAGVSVYDTEVCEIGMGWVDVTTAAVAIDWTAAATTITTMVNGSRVTDAFHSGTIGSTALSSAGYCIYGSGASCITASAGNVTVDGVFFVMANSGVDGFSSTRFGAVVKNCVLRGNKPAGASSQTGIRLNTPACVCTIHDNIWLEIGGGGLYTMANQGAGTLVYNNLAHNCNVGFYAEGLSNRGFYYNNISVGNDTNWSVAPAALEGAGYNGGESGNTPWNTGTATAITTFDSTDFSNYTTHDFRPASSSAPQVETGTAVPNGESEDIIAGYRPSYIDAITDKWDLGPFEYDWGNGLPPEVHTIDFSGLVAGSQVIVYTTNTTTELFRDDNCSATESYDGGNGAVVDYTILKTGYAPIRVTGVALTATSTPVTVQQDLDRAYASPSGLTFGTNAIVNVSSRVVTSMQVTTATTVQNWYSYLMDSWIASSTNTTLKNVAFPIIPFGEASFTVINGIQFSDGATSIAFFKRDGLRYSSNAGTTITAIWAAILTLNTPAGQQVKYRQSPAGAITNASNTGPMDQLVQIYGDATHGNYDYRDHMVLRAPKVGWSQPKPDIVATYGNLVDGLFVAALEPTLQYATTDADIDAANLVLNNTTKTYTITAAHTMLELYQRAQWWANQDAQWDADIPLTTTDGSTFTQPSNWSMIGVANLTGGTLAGGSTTIATGTQNIAFNGVTLSIGAAGTYTFTMAGSCTVSATPTSASNYILGSGTFNGTLTFHNTTAYNITVEVPTGTTTSSAGSPGAGTVTFVSPSVYQSVTVSNITATSRLQIYDTTSSTELYNGVPGATSYTWTDLVPVVATRAIRVRIADVVGDTAKEFIEANIGTCAVSGSGKDISYLASQSNDTTYNNNAVDGPAIYATSGITFTDAATDLVNCNIAGGSVTWPTIYACFVYWNFTATGIANDFTYIEAPDTANYILSGMKIKNTSSPSVPLVVSLGYGRDFTTDASVDLADTTGGTLIFAPDHVVTKIVSVGGVNIITGDITDIPTVSEIVTGVVTDAATLTVNKFLALGD